MDGESYRSVCNEISCMMSGLCLVVSSMNLGLSSMQELSLVLFTFGQINPSVSHKKSIKLVKNCNLCPY